MTDNITAKAFNGLRHWQAAVMGSKPTDAMLATASHFCRVGKQGLAFAMTLRPEGATDGQQKAACIAVFDGSSGSHHNKRRDLEGARYFKRDMNASKGDGHTVYKYDLTDKGKAFIDKAVAVAAAEGDAKPAKVKAKGKAPAKRKPRPAKVTASVDTQPGTEAAPQGDAVTDQPQS